MRFVSKFLFALMTFATCLPASAQQKAGTFKLPYATTWNHVLVPAGEYSISIYSASQEISMLEPASGRQSGVFLVPVAHEYDARCANSALSMTKEGQDWRVQSICFADTGLKLYFTPPASNAVPWISASAKPTSDGGAQ